MKMDKYVNDGDWAFVRLGGVEGVVSLENIDEGMLPIWQVVHAVLNLNDKI